MEGIALALRRVGGKGRQLATFDLHIGHSLSSKLFFFVAIDDIFSRFLTSHENYKDRVSLHQNELRYKVNFSNDILKNFWTSKNSPPVTKLATVSFF